MEATKTLVSSLVLSRLHYCNALLTGSPRVLLDKIQRVVNCSARLIYKASKSAHITPLLFDLHWLPTSNRIQYKIALTCFHIISGTAPPYLSELLRLYSPSRSLRSASNTRIFRVPRVCRRTLGERSFQYIGPVIWNSFFLCQACHVTLLFKVKTKKSTSSLLPTDFSLSFFCFHQTHDFYACVFAVCVCMCVCVCVWGCGGVCGCVHVWVWRAYLLCKHPGLS